MQQVISFPKSSHEQEHVDHHVRLYIYDLTHMPIGTYISFQFLGTMIPAVFVVLAQLATPGGPGPQDAWSVLGAMVAAFIVVHRESKGGTLSLWRTPILSSFLASVFIGSVGPGLTINTLLPFFFDGFVTKNAALITWHGWAAFGLVYGLSGWWLVKGWMAISRKIPDRMESEAEKRLGIPKERNNPDWIEENKP